MNRVVASLRDSYRAVLPDALRFPIGRARRRVLDGWLRLRTRGPLPPSTLLDRVQMTPYVDEYLRVGRASADAVGRELAAGGVGEGARVLDFGCGLGRTLRWLAGRGYRLEGCDVDPRQIEWTRRAFPGLRVLTSPLRPPLPYSAGRFDAIYAISVFTHFDADEQRSWFAELARILRPGGLLVISTMGSHALTAFPALEQVARAMDADGFGFDAGGPRFNQRGAFHSVDGLARLASPDLHREHSTSGGLDGFQDLHRLRRGVLPAPPRPGDDAPSRRRSPGTG